MSRSVPQEQVRPARNTVIMSVTPPDPFNVWLLAARPKTLIAGASPVLMGTALAAGDGALHVPAALLALAGALLIQVGTNFWNDVADHGKGADTPDRIGPPRAVAMGWISPAAMRRATVLVFALAAVCCMLLVVRASWPLAVLALISILLGFGYTSGPFPLAYLGVADLFVLVFFGPVAVGGTYYVQALDLPGRIMVAGLAPGLVSGAILVANNLRDREQDARARKRTLVVRFGRRFGQIQYSAFLLGGLALPAALALFQDRPYAKFILLLLLPPAFVPLRTVWTHRTSRDLIPVLGKTAGLLAAMTLLFVVTWSWG